jgi:predicted acyltransferase
MNRQISLDVFRGLTLAAMLLVNNPGSWSQVYAPLLHASWHGLTPTDLIFPFFLFIVGAAMYYSMAKFAKSTEASTQHLPWLKILKRTTLLFFIGFLLNIYPFLEPATDWRIMGVLQRIAICYGIAAILICVLNLKQVLCCCVILLLGYWGLLNLVSLPYGLSSNLVKIVDVFILGKSHLYQGFGIAFEPEGILSCLPAIVTVLAGYLTSAMLNRYPSAKQQCQLLILWGMMASLLGGFWHVLLPINKALWTSSYVLVTCGIAWLVLAVIIYLHDIKQYKRWFNWAQIYGSNPLFIYVLAWLFAATLPLIHWQNNADQLVDVQGFVYQGLSAMMPAKLASLIFAVAFVALFYQLAKYLYQRKIFIKL